jgi:LAS superfamily LD-carboxypeptidase LdcB
VSDALVIGALLLAAATSSRTPSTNGELAPVNQAGRPETGWKAGRSFALLLFTIDDAGHELADAPAEAFLAMRAAARAAGVELHVNSAWRSYAKQAELRQLFLDGEGPQAAPPGYSNHEAGEAVDIETAQGSNAAYWWLVSNAGRFGFRPTVATEPWHWEYA